MGLKIEAPEYKIGMGGIDIILNETRWKEGICHLTFGQRSGRTYIPATLINPVTLTMPETMMRAMEESARKDGIVLNQDFSGEMEKALGDHGEKEYSLPAGLTMYIFGLICNWEKRDDYFGHLGDPIAMCIPEGTELTSAPFHARDLHIDWLGVNGLNKTLTDITADVLIQRLVMEKVRGSSPRSIITY
jgi:hypothetical protein